MQDNGQNESDFIFVQKHVWNAVRNGKFSVRFRTNKVAIDELYLEEGMVGLLKELFVVFVVCWGSLWQVVQMAQLLGRPAQTFPVNLWVQVRVDGNIFFLNTFDQGQFNFVF